LALEPDDQARGVVRLIFDKFAELESMSGVLRYLRDHEILIGVRDHRGLNKGQLQWRRVNQATLLGILHHPVYAGAYVYGRRETNPRKVVPGQPGRGRRWARPEDWDVLIRDKLPAYISWEQWQKNQQRLRENSAKYHAGGPTRGTSLTAGRVVCGRCGRRMSISYSGQSKARFTCDMSRNQWGQAQCQAFNARPLQELIEKQLLHALSPASIELSLHAARQIEADRDQLERHYHQTIERTRYHSALARSRYEAVDPANRLVAAELERRWEAALVAQREAEEALDRFRQQQPSRLTAQQEARIQALSLDIPQLWQASTTSGVDRQKILRALLDEIVVEVLGQSERVRVTLRWAGGFESHHEIRRPVGKFEKLESADQIRARLIELKQCGYSHSGVAAALNAEGFHAAGGGPLTTPIVSQLCRKLRQQGLDLQLGSESRNRWTLTSLALHLNMKPETLSTWRRRGWVHAERVGPRWMFWANPDELNRLQKLVGYHRRRLQQTPATLTTPKPH
jgi:hypothetical protein